MYALSILKIKLEVKQETLKELRMEQKRYQKNYWNKFFLFLIAVGVAVLIFFYWIQKTQKNNYAP